MFVDRSKKQSYYPGRIEDYEPVSEKTLSTHTVSLLLLFAVADVNVCRHSCPSLTPSTPAVPNCCCSKGSAPY